MKLKKLIGILVGLAVVLSITVTTMVFAGGASYETEQDAYVPSEENVLLTAQPVNLEELFTRTFGDRDELQRRGWQGIDLSQPGFDLSGFDFSELLALEAMFSDMFDLSDLMNQAIVDFIRDFERMVLAWLQDFDWDELEAGLGEFDFDALLERFGTIDFDVIIGRIEAIDFYAVLDRLDELDFETIHAELMAIDWEGMADEIVETLGGEEEIRRRLESIDWDALYESFAEMFEGFELDFDFRKLLDDDLRERVRSLFP